MTGEKSRSLQRHLSEISNLSANRILKIGSKHRFENFFWWETPFTDQLCCKALEHNIEMEYVQHIIKAFRFEPPSDSNENWPYPLKIYTLGRFEIHKDGEPLIFLTNLEL